MCLLKKKIILTHVKTAKKTLFKTIVLGADSIATGERDRAQLPIQQDKWQITVNEQIEGVSGLKITKRRHQE